MYKVVVTKTFSRQLKRYKEKAILTKVEDLLLQIHVDPFVNRLKTHKVTSRVYGQVYSSRITGDLRLIWDFDGEKIYIYLLAIGGHSGAHKVYNR